MSGQLPQAAENLAVAGIVGFQIEAITF
jgi:hypothetical protein